MQNTPKGLRLHVAIAGKTNAGKSTFLNLMTGQEVSIVSEISGTTTDVVEKAQEFHLLGPVLWLDTAGLDDKSPLCEERKEKTLAALERADVVVLVQQENDLEPFEIKGILKNEVPIIKVINKKGACQPHIEGKNIVLNAADFSQRDAAVLLVQQALLEVCPQDFTEPATMLKDLTTPEGLVLMIVPIDYEAPKGRLILPQVQAIRECLDNEQTVVVVKESAYVKTLECLKKEPDLVVCDSQAVRFMIENTPPSVKCTTFSILMARLKGDLKTFVSGAKAIWTLKDKDKVLIAESCTHHASKDDIGTVKIPALMRKKTGKDLIFEHVSGCDFAVDLKSYKLIIHCGACTQNRRAVLARIEKALAAGVDITNYGLCLSELNGVLDRVLEPFKY